jgi:hypothetical protein
VARLGKVLASGQFTAESHPLADGVGQETACRYCSYRPLCGKKEAMGAPLFSPIETLPRVKYPVAR